jgi:GT2 family glycosyltransferase
MCFVVQFAIKKNFNFISGFDEKYPFAAMEDVDLHTRLINAGGND